MTGELSKLLSEMKKCRDFSFEELCPPISSHSMESFGSARLSDEERGGTLGRRGKVGQVGGGREGGQIQRERVRYQDRERDREREKGIERDIDRGKGERQRGK